MTFSFEHQKLKNWFLAEKRDLPWRIDPTPYGVWISEMMLQQTQVAVVIPYFERWMLRFPNIQKLAEASVDDVIKVWEGLGYYSRARYIHQGAIYLLKNHGGELPESEVELSKIKGLGIYTVGAIRSFAFHQKTAAVDGNVIRVIARYFMIEDDIAKTKTLATIRDIANEILPDEEHWINNEALIELGATVCGRKPKCGECPLRGSCRSYAQGVTDKLPYKSTKTTITHLYRTVAIVICGDMILVRKGKKGEIMSDLYEFPYFEATQEGILAQQMEGNLQKQFSFAATWQRSLPEVAHSFTRYRVKLMPMQFSCSTNPCIENYQWLTLSQLKEFAFSSGHRRILQTLSKDT